MICSAPRVRPRAVCLGNLFRDQLDRYGELEHVAERWRVAVRRLPPDAALVVNGDDPQVGDLARERPGAVTFGVDDPRRAHPSLQHAADSKYCVRCGTPYEYAAPYVGHLGDYPCPSCGHGRPALNVRARQVELAGLDGVTFTLETPEGARELRLAVPGLYNVYNALAAASLARALGASLAVVALNDGIADGRDVSWIWDVDFEPLIGGLETLVATGDRAAELALRFKYGGMDPDAIEVVPSLERALDRGLELTPAGNELLVLPTYTAMLALRKIVSSRGFVRPYWERAA